MSNAETELLRESIDQLTQDIEVPAGLADRVVQRHRQRRIALRAAVASGTAVLAAAGAFTAVTAGPSAAPGIAPGAAHKAASRVSAQNMAYVSARTERALAAVQRGNLIEQIHTVSHHYPLGLVQVRVIREHGQTYRVIMQSGNPATTTASQENSWYYRGQLREVGLDAAGKTLFDASSTTSQTPAGRHSIMNISGTGADYTSNTWWHAAASVPMPAAPKQSPCKSAYLPPPAGSPINWPAAIRAGLSCGHLRLAGHEQVGTVRAIKLVSVKVDGPYSVSLAVDPVSYLPLRMTYHWLDPRASGPGTLTSNFTWTRPTPANLGALRVTVPSGFRHVHGGGLPMPGANF